MIQWYAGKILWPGGIGPLKIAMDPRCCCGGTTTCDYDLVVGVFFGLPVTITRSSDSTVYTPTGTTREIQTQADTFTVEWTGSPGGFDVVAFDAAYTDDVCVTVNGTAVSLEAGGVQQYIEFILSNFSSPLVIVVTCGTR